MNKFIPLLFIFLLFSCSGLKREYPVRNFYTLEVVNVIKTDAGNGNNFLKIERADVNHTYYQREFNYRIGHDEFISDYYHQFYKPISILVTAEIYKWFTNSGLFKGVLPVSSLVNAKYLLDSNIVDIYGDFTDPVNPKAVLNMQFFLINDSLTISKLVYSNIYNQEIEISSKAPSALIEGWNKALKQIFIQLETDLSTIENL